jgi:hypothetical protein
MTNHSLTITKLKSNIGSQHSSLRLADSPAQPAGGKDTDKTALLHANPRVLERMAADPIMPATVLNLLARHTEPAVRAAVSDNSNTAPTTIRALATDGDPTVRYRLAENPHLPKEILHALSNDDNPYVARRAERTISRLSSL